MLGLLGASVRAFWDASRPDACPMRWSAGVETLSHSSSLLANHPAPSIPLSSIEPIVRGVRCSTVALTRSGLAPSGRGDGCADLGLSKPIGNRSSPEGKDPLRYLPTPAALQLPPRRAALEAAHSLQRELASSQLRGSGCAATNSSIYYVETLPTIGFGTALEFFLMHLSVAVHRGDQLVLGSRALVEWAPSEALCGEERSPRCFFAFSSCCATPSAADHAADKQAAASRRAAAAGARATGGTAPSRLRRRRVRLGGRSRKGGKAGGGGTISIPRYERFGSLWLRGQLIRYLFSRMTYAVRKQVELRRESVSVSESVSVDRGSALALPAAIGMHIRRGDSCALGSRYCPSDLNASYFEAADELRTRYGVNRLVLATDDPEAARLCNERVRGFDCHTVRMDRHRFTSSTSIELRVGTEGALEGSGVALDTLADIELLSECDHFVLVLRSAVSRLAYALATARHNRFPPIISMQWAWDGRGGQGLALKY